MATPSVFSRTFVSSLINGSESSYKEMRCELLVREEMENTYLDLFA